VTGLGRRGVLVTLALGAGAPAVELSTSLDQFHSGTPELAASRYVDRNLSGGEANVTQSLVVIRTTATENATREKRSVLTREEYLQHLRAQRALLASETVARTLPPRRAALSIANVVAVVAVQ
jgi:hypothetical protein